MKQGEYYKIRNTMMSGKKIIEGTAKLLRKVEGPGRWLVRFNDGDEVKRVVLNADKV